MDKKKLDRKVEYSINKNKYKVERKIKNNNKIKCVGCCCLAIILIAAIGSIWFMIKTQKPQQTPQKIKQ